MTKKKKTKEEKKEKEPDYTPLEAAQEDFDEVVKALLSVPKRIKKTKRAGEASPKTQDKSVQDKS